MSLFIRDDTRVVEWHVGEPWPYLDPASQVFSFVADGDELRWLLDLIKSDRAKAVV